MRDLLASTCLAAVALSSAAAAETVISDKRTATIRSATVKAGAPDDIRIGAAGSVVPTLAGAAVILDSNNRLVNEGTIQFTNIDGSDGVRAEAGVSGSITNAASAKIILDESYTPADADNDGDLDGPLATGSARTGIRTVGAFHGDVVNNGQITIEGKDSAGIRLGGALDGRLVQDGTIAVTGDRAVGIRVGDVTGGVQAAVVGQPNSAARIAGTVSATGLNASAVSVDGNINGSLVLQGSLSATGYRYTTPPSDISKLDADDLLQGGPAVRIAGDVAGGVIVAVPPKDSNPSDNDEDKDGIEDAKEGSGAITSLGSAAALEIGSATRAVTLGAVGGNGDGHGLVIEGVVSGAGVYAGVNGNGIAIGGLGQVATIAGGMTVKGAVSASGASATAIRIGAGATVPELLATGKIEATGKNTANAATVAVQIDAGGHLFEIRNSGTISASVSGTATGQGAAATATAILDRSGELDFISNSGTIVASGASAGNNVAIDLSANGTGARVGQTVVASGVAAPSISGDIRFGSGNDVLDLADGTMAGNSSFGTGTNQLLLSGDATYKGSASFGAGDDILALNGTSAFTGDIDFGGGSDKMTLTGSARFSGTLANAKGLAVAVTGGTLDIGATTASVGSLNVGPNGSLLVAIDGAARTGTLYQVAGQASLEAGSKVVVTLAGVAGAEGTHVFVRAGSISLPTTIAPTSAVVPYMFKGTVSAVSPTEIAVNITRKSAAELGLNRSQATAYDAIYTALGKDAKVAGVYLAKTDGAAFRRQLRQMLPDHAGGSFEAVTMGSRATAGYLADPDAPFADQGRWGYWIQQVGWGTAKSIGDTASYDISGWGIAMGGEIKTGIGGFGLSLAYLAGTDADGGTDNKVNANQYEVGLSWRGGTGPLKGWARLSWAHVDFRGQRRFQGSSGSEAVERRARGDWSGRLVSAAAGASYDLAFGRFGLRPKLAVDYYRLKEKGYAETGGGDAFNLIVGGRKSDELAVTGALVAGLAFGGQNEDAGWFRIEAEGGRRQLAGGSLGSTRAHFSGGAEFILVPEQRTSGWIGKLRAVGGGNGFRIGGEVGAEQQQGRAALSLRASLAIGL